ncbi:MAG: DUF1592 domain-containing protein [Polyangiales bacterium]
MSSFWNNRRQVLFALAIVAGCKGNDAGTTGPQPIPEGPVGPAVPSLSGAQRLTVAQYRAAIRDLFGPEVVVPPALEPDVAIDGFISVGASKSTISARGVEQYESAAYAIANQIVGDAKLKARVLSCSSGDAACAKTFAKETGRRVFRRPLADSEIEKLANVIATAQTTLGTFDKGLVYGLAALLQSPHFLYRPAVGEADPEHPGQKRYTGYELATRLAIFLWSSVPDDALLDAAQSGALGSYDGIKAQVDRMLASPKARDGLRNFVAEWLGLGELDRLEKDAKLFTTYTPDLGPMAREETLRVFEDLVFDRDQDVRDVMTTKNTFVTPKLASMYEVLAPSPDGFAKVTLPDDSPRRGLLGQIAILSLYAHPTSSSATLRGKFVRQKLLCVEIPAPPVNVNTALPEPTDSAKTLRDRVKIHFQNPTCAGCHKIMDPIGLGLEQFDGIGRWRTKENGATIDPSGTLDGTDFGGPSDLAQVIHDHRDFPTCIVKKLYAYATGFTPADVERPTIDALAERFAAAGYRMKPLLSALATSPAFRAFGAAQ